MLLAQGEATLVGGRVTVPLKRIPANAVVLPQRKTSSINIGDLTYTIAAGVSFTIVSANALETSVVRWAVLV